MSKYTPRPSLLCADCSSRRNSPVSCPATRIITEWVKDATGMSRTVSGGVCARVEGKAEAA